MLHSHPERNDPTMTTPTSHTATITVDHDDRALIRAMLFVAANEIGNHFGDRIVSQSLIVYHEMDAPKTARVTWMLQPPDLARASG